MLPILPGTMVEAFVTNTFELALISAPWLVLGLVSAGLIRAWLPMELVGRTLGGTGIGPVTRAALIGAPLPLCSCGTLPAAFSLRRSGASRAATTSFLIATPETGVDSVALSWVLLGPLLALLRPFSALVSAITAGLLVGQTEQSAVRDPMAIRLEPAPAQDACDSGTCCDCGPPAAVLPEDEQRVGFARRALDGLRYAFSDLLDDLVLWLVFGILAAGMVVTLVPPGLLAAWGSGLWAMLLILLISVPMYVCATASTPLAHAMLFAGVSPGTVLVFLLAGPASNLAGLLLVRRELGSRALTAYLVGVAGISVALGLGLDWVVALFDIDILAGMANSGAQERELPVMLSMLCLLLLAVAAIRPFRRYLIQGKAGKNGSCCD